MAKGCNSPETFLHSPQPSPQGMSRRLFIGSAISAGAGLIAAHCNGVLRTRPESEGDHATPFEEIEDDSALIGRKILFTVPTKKERAHVAVQIIPSGKQELSVRVDGKAYDIDCTIGLRGVTAFITDVRRRLNAIVFFSSFGNADVDAQAIAGAALDVARQQRTTPVDRLVMGIWATFHGCSLVRDVPLKRRREADE